MNRFAHPAARRACRAVVFDVGGTILRVEPSLGVLYARAAARHGFPLEPAALEARFAAAWRRSLARSRGRAHRCSDEILRDEWRTVVGETFAGELPPPVLDRVFRELYEMFVSPSAWSLAEGAEEALRRLRAYGIRLGILSNWDSRLPATLEGLGIGHLFDFTVVSYEVGFEKPHPAIFQEALRRAGASPAEVLHVGDSRELDILPAQRLGMRTLWIRGGAAPPPPAREHPWAAGLGEVNAALWAVLLGG